MAAQKKGKLEELSIAKPALAKSFSAGQGGGEARGEEDAEESRTGGQARGEESAEEAGGSRAEEAHGRAARRQRRSLRRRRRLRQPGSLSPPRGAGNDSAALAAA
ncbi:MAG: hypothetical protein MZW92_03560 [Comamonadaceae bacterium]|nr:hypothetical protein [Comamonadaceae bacterium]